MSEKENRLNELNKELKPYTILGVISTILVIIAGTWIIIGSIIKDNPVVDILFWIGIGAFAATVILVVAGTIIKSDAINERNKIKKEK